MSQLRGVTGVTGTVARFGADFCNWDGGAFPLRFALQQQPRRKSLIRKEKMPRGVRHSSYKPVT